MQPKQQQQHWRRLKSLPVLIAPTFFFSFQNKKKRDFFSRPLEIFRFFFLLRQLQVVGYSERSQCVSSNKSRLLLLYSCSLTYTRAIKVWWCRKKTSGPDKPGALFFLRVVNRLKKLFDFSSIFSVGGFLDLWTFSKANRRTISHGRRRFGGRKSCQSARSVSFSSFLAPHRKRHGENHKS